MNHEPFHHDGEFRSAITLGDFVGAWMRWRGWFLGGLAVAAVGTFVWAYFFMTPFYRAEASFFVTQRFTPESRAGLAETQVYQGGLNEQFQAVFLATAAEQYLRGGDLLLSAADRLAAERGIDLADVLSIEDSDPDRRRRKLAHELTRKLVAARRIENSGVIVVTAELPDPYLAADYLNFCLDELQRRFAANELDYFQDVLAAYRRSYEEQGDKRDEMAAEMDALRWDDSPRTRARRQQIDATLQEQARGMGEMHRRIEMLAMATGQEARQAIRPVTVIDPATAPLRKSRPKTILMTVTAASLYTFVFMVILTLAGLLGMARTPPPPSPGAPAGPRTPAMAGKGEA